MIAIGKWEAALSLAPAVSMQYWKKLAHEYADFLQREQNERATSYYVATGDASSAINMYQERQQYEDAYLIAKVYSDGSYPSFSTEVDARDYKSLCETSQDETQIRVNEILVLICPITLTKYKHLFLYRS